MSLQADILRAEIAKLKQEKMTDRVAQLLSIYWTALQAVCDEPQPVAPVQVASVPDEPMGPVTEGTGVFHDAVRGKRPEDVYNVLEQHFSILSAIAPKHYKAVMDALDKLQ